MKLLLALSALVAAASAMTEIHVDSDAGRHLLSEARRVEQNNNNNNGDNWEEQFNWVAGYSVKFQGCHSIKQWNDYADGEEDVRLAIKNLVRFRLCPSESCSSTKAAGCSSGYGDYIIDMATFMESYGEASRQITEYNCQKYLYDTCNCEDDGNQGDDFNEEYCEYDCFNDAGLTECIDRNPYDENQGEQQRFEMQDYLECRQLEINNNNGNRKLEEGQDAAVQYYVGPYCAGDGSGIFLGLFTDETCTEQASAVTFKELMGYDLPYDDTSLVDASCMSCVETNNEQNNNNNNNNNNNGDANDADAVREQCENLYMMSGKCESHYPEGMISSPNNNACTYMEGVKIVRKDGIISAGAVRPSGAATAFIVIFAMCFVAMGFYVWYLRTRLGVKKNTLL